MTPHRSAARRPLSTVAFNWAMVRRSAGALLAHSLFHTIFLAAPIGLGLVERMVFDTITGAAPAGLSVWTLIALYVAAGAARLAASFPDIWFGATFRAAVGARLRRTMFAALLRRPGAADLPVPVGETLNRYSDDVGEVSDFPTWLPEVAGHLIALAAAILIMAQVNPTLTLIVCLPIAATIALTRALWAQLMRQFEQEGQANDRATGLLGEMLAAVQAIKLAGAEPGFLAELDRIGERRRQIGVRKELLWGMVSSAGALTSTVGVGAVLLLAGAELQSGRMTVGDFALFLTYIWYIAEVPTVIGTFIGDYQQQAVSIARLTELIPDEPPGALVADLPVAPPQAPLAPARPGAPLLELCGLSCRYPGGGGVGAIDLRIMPGTLTVVTGRIGAGKTTLLRAILGLLPADSGEIRWRGEPVADPALHFRPPHAAYAPQVPRLFSATLRENIQLGYTAGPPELAAALHDAALLGDLDQLADGLETLVGPRGVRLSGGQAQRCAAARALVRRPELLVLDDLSSALDVETERQLWERLLARSAAPRTILAVTHRQALIDRADQVIRLQDGRIV